MSVRDKLIIIFLYFVIFPSDGFLPGQSDQGPQRAEEAYSQWGGEANATEWRWKRVEPPPVLRPRVHRACQVVQQVLQRGVRAETSNKVSLPI